MHTPSRKRVVGDKLDQVLRLACAQKSRLKLASTEIQFPFFAKIYTTRPGQVLLEGIQPEPTDEDLLIDSEIAIVFPLTSRGYFIGRAHYLGVTKEQSSAARHVISQPDELNYIKERRCARIVPPRSMPIYCLAIDKKKTDGSVLVRDISREGICLTLGQNTGFEVGEPFRKIKIKLHGNSYLTADAVVRHTFQTRDGYYCIGLMWEPMGRSQFGILRTYLELAEDKIRASQQKAGGESLFFEFEKPEDDTVEKG